MRPTSMEPRNDFLAKSLSIGEEDVK